MRFVLNCEIAGLNAVSEELVQRSLNALPVMKPFLTPGGGNLRNAYGSFHRHQTLYPTLCIFLVYKEIFQKLFFHSKD